MVISENMMGGKQLTGNSLKLIAAIAMLIDHAGVYLFPQHLFLRIIGRLAFPIFAFMIAQGCHYTKNRLRYFLSVFLLGMGWHGVQWLLWRDNDLNILLTFSCSIPLIFLLQEWKRRKRVLLGLTFAASLLFVYLLDRYISFDYGFLGVTVPILVALVFPARGKSIEKKQNLLQIAILSAGLLVLSVHSAPIQFYCLLALPLLLLYSGERGKNRYKYAFYLFYPLHLLLLRTFAWLMAL